MADPPGTGHNGAIEKDKKICHPGLVYNLSSADTAGCHFPAYAGDAAAAAL